MAENTWFDTDSPLLLDFPWLRILREGRVYTPGLVRLRHRVSGYADDSPVQTEHRHGVYHFIFCVEGANAFIINGREYPFGRGDYFMIDPDTPHNIVPRNRDYVRFFALTFRIIGEGNADLLWSWERVLSYLFSHRTEARGTLGEDQCLAAAEDFSGFLNDLLNPGVGEPSRLGLRFLDFIHRFYLRLPGEEKALPLSPMERTVKFIRDNYGQPLSIEDLARTARLSRSRFIEAFARRYHRTPMKYLNDYRLDRASYLLSHSSLSIQEIAYKCGFSSLSYFGKAFRKSRGLSAGEFRAEFRD